MVDISLEMSFVPSGNVKEIVVESPSSEHWVDFFLLFGVSLCGISHQVQFQTR